VLRVAGEMQMFDEGHKIQEHGRTLNLTEELRRTVLRGQTTRVGQLLSQGAPLVTDRVSH